MNDHRLRVAHIVPSYIAGGIERLIELAALPMAERGIDYVLVVHSNEISAADNLRSKNIPIHVLPLKWHGFRFWLSYPKELRRVLEELDREERIDLVHVHHCWSYHIAYIIAKRLGKKLVISTHNRQEPWQTDNSFWGRILRTQIRQAHEYASVVIPVGEAVRQDVLQLNWRIKRLETIENFVDEGAWKHFNPNPARTYDIVMLGRLAPQKNVLFALKVIAKLRDRMPDLRVAILGDGPQRPEVEREIEALKLDTGTVELFGQRPLDEVFAVGADSKVFYAPSIREGLSLASVEVLALGLFAVMADIPPFKLTFPDEEGITFVDNLDIDQNVEALYAAITSFRPIQREHLRKRFSLNKNVDAIAAVYRSIADPT